MEGGGSQTKGKPLSELWGLVREGRKNKGGRKG